MTIAVPVEFTDKALTAEIAEDLAVVETALRDTSFGGNEMFAEVSRHMMAARTRRLSLSVGERPSFLPTD